MRPQSRRCTFPLHLRIPRWAIVTTFASTERRVPDVAPGEFARIERAWRAGDRVDPTADDAAASTWYRDSVAIERGPLVFSLPLERTGEV